MAVLCVFGDSTAWGAWDRKKGGWVNRLWLYAAERELDLDVYNLSISGGTTRDLVRRFAREAKERDPTMIIIQSGGNDAARVGGRHQIHPAEFRQNIFDLIRQARRFTNKIIFFGFENVDEKRTTPVSWHPVCYWNADIQKYRDIMAEVCKKHHILFIDLFGLLSSKDLFDGVHPNARGHEKIFKKVLSFLTQKKLLLR